MFFKSISLNEVTFVIEKARSIIVMRTWMLFEIATLEYKCSLSQGSYADTTELDRSLQKPTQRRLFSRADYDVGTGVVGTPACGDVMKLKIR